MTGWHITLTPNGAPDAVVGDLWGYDVEKRYIPRPGNKPFIPLTDQARRKSCAHTTEGASGTDPDDIDDAWDWMSSQGFGPHFLAGEGRIIQCRPLYAQASTLKTPEAGGYYPNAYFICQVEQVANSKFDDHPWMPDPDVAGPMAAIMAFYAIEFDVPLIVPFAWSDVHNGPYYGPNVRRDQAQAFPLEDLAGWFHHFEVPYNLHADCGSYARHDMLIKAAVLVDDFDSGGDGWMALFDSKEEFEATVRGALGGYKQDGKPDLTDDEIRYALRMMTTVRDRYTAATGKTDPRKAGEWMFNALATLVPPA